MSGLFRHKQLLDLQINNEQVLSKQLEATNDRFRVGEITRTDVAQAEAALGGCPGNAGDGGRQSADRSAARFSRLSVCFRPTTWSSHSR